MQLCINYCAFVNAKLIGGMVISCTDAKSVKDNGHMHKTGIGKSNSTLCVVINPSILTISFNEVKGYYVLNHHDSAGQSVILHMTNSL